MRISSVFSAAVIALGLGAAPVLAGATDPVKVYPYQTSENFCPAGLQPVSVSGVISCGTPTETVSYQQAMRHR